ncbi:hypothetical protein BXZ70DRAFT_388946 [Cristinia sonorae]|uniref:Uncharacterized protein n=1 Tax=Cristinia sonorae TaxID=1940300 RepID=A0A8K0UJM4_9AGAR|nr:hypothetical protein BXZ70DRAFT_388946 [Cristinia sonorae]
MTENRDTVLHILTAESPDLDVILPGLVSFSNGIYSADPTSKYASIDYWKQRLSHPASVIIYLTAAHTDDPEESITPIGFLFAHPRSHTPPLPVSGQTETLHIWLAAVSPKWRRAGCLEKMVNAIPSGGFGVMSVCTHPERFPNMWKWVRGRGWQVEQELEEGKICLSKPVTPTA